MIDTKALRQKILDLAFQGKLTEQLPEDGTGEELFQQIQEEKRRLEDEGKIKKNKPLPQIDETEIPFEIPESWKWARWGELANSLQYGYIDSAKRSGQVKMVRISDIHDNKVDWDSVPYCNIDDQDLETYRLYDNDILFARTGGTVGKSYLVSNIRGDAVFAGYLIRTNYSQLLNAKYIKYFMDSQLYWKQLQNGTIATAQPNCNGQTLSKMILPLPPVTEQGRIVALIDSSFLSLDYIDNIQKRYQDNLNILKSKLIDAAIQGKLTEQLPEDGTAEELYQQIQQEKRKLEAEGKIKKEKALPPVSEDEIPFDIPQNWKWCRLIDVGTTNIGLTYHPQDICSDGITVIRSSNIQNGKMDYSDIVKVKCDIRENQYLMKNDIVICARNGSKALVGKCAIYEGESYTESFGAFMAIFRTPIFRYLYFYFNTMAFRRYFSGDDSKQINQVTQNTLKESVFPLPPLAEQKRIVAKLEELLPLCE